MTRARNVVPRLRRRRRILKLAKGFWGGRKNLIRTAKETVLRAGAFAYAHRRRKKRDFRRLWILRINAAARANGISYSKLIAAMKAADIQLDRKALSELAFHDPEAFGAVVEKARAAAA